MKPIRLLAATVTLIFAGLVYALAYGNIVLALLNGLVLVLLVQRAWKVRKYLLNPAPPAP